MSNFRTGFPHHRAPCKDPYGEWFYSEDEIDKARVCFEGVIAVDHQNYEALNNLGMIQFREGQLGEAISYFHRALEIRDGYEEALEDLAAVEPYTFKAVAQKIVRLGCGQRWLEGFLNIDVMPSADVDIQCGSRRLPLQFTRIRY